MGRRSGVLVRDVVMRMILLEKATWHASYTEGTPHLLFTEASLRRHHDGHSQMRLVEHARCRVKFD